MTQICFAASNHEPRDVGDRILHLQQEQEDHHAMTRPSRHRPSASSSPSSPLSPSRMDRMLVQQLGVVVLLILLPLLLQGSNAFVPLNQHQQRHSPPYCPPPRQPTSNHDPRSNRNHYNQQNVNFRVTTITATALAAVGKTGGDVLTTAEAFRERVLESESPVMVFFTAPWCGPCRLSIPVVKDVMREYMTSSSSTTTTSDGNAKPKNAMPVVEICTDDLPTVASEAGVVSIPTIQMYANRGVVQETIVGCVAKAVLSTAVEKVLEDYNSNTSASSAASSTSLKSADEEK